MKKTNAIKVKSGNSNTGINKAMLKRFKSADDFLAHIKTKEHVYASFGKNDNAIKETWQDAQPKTEAKPKDK